MAGLIVVAPFAASACVVPVSGCTNIAAANYNIGATVEDGSCVFHHSHFAFFQSLGIFQIHTTLGTELVGSSNSTYQSSN